MSEKVKAIGFVLASLLLLNMGSAAETTILNPEHDSTVDFGQESLSVEWESVQDHSSSDSIVESEIEIDDGNNIVTKTIDRSGTSSLNDGESVTYTYEFSETAIGDFEEGLWDIRVTDYWEETSDGGPIQGGDQITIDAENVGGGSASSVGVVIDAPGANYEHTVGNDLLVEWTSEVEGEAELVESRIVVTGDQGSTYETTVNQEEFYSSDTQHSLTIDSSNLGFSSGSWNIRVTDTWSSSEASDDRFFSASSGSDDGSSSGGGATNIEDEDSTDDSGSSDSSDSTDNSTEDDGGVIIDGGGESAADGGSDQTSDTGDSEDSTSNGDTSDSADSSGGDSQDSSDGSGNDDGSTDTSGSSDDSSGTSGDSSDGGSDSGTDDQDGSDTGGDSSVSNVRSVLEKDVAAGFTVRTVLLVIAAILLFVVLFWRSNYELTI